MKTKTILHTNNRNQKQIATVVAILSVCIGAFAQVRTIWVPASSGGGPAASQGKIEGPVTLTSEDGIKHVLKQVALTGASYAMLGDLRLSSQELDQGWLAFATHENFPPRDQLQKSRETCFWTFLPLGAIEGIRELPKNASGVKMYNVTLRGERPTLPPLAIDTNACQFHLIGKEEMGDFGVAEFNEQLGRFGKVTSVSLPAMPEIPIASKSPLSATVVEVSGNTHLLSDIRVNDFTFFRGDSKLVLPVGKIQRIDVVRTMEYSLLCSVTLRTGAQQELV